MNTLVDDDVASQPMSSMPNPVSMAAVVSLGCVLGLLSCGSTTQPAPQSQPVGSSVAGTAAETTTSPPTSTAVLPEPTDNPNPATTDSSPTSSSEEPTAVAGSNELVPLRFESNVADVSVSELENTALAVLNDSRGWVKAGFQFVSDPTSEYRVVLAEGDEVDRLCLPLKTGGTVSCQNGPVVALNADRWRMAVPHWDAEVKDYRGYLVNHEVGHLIGQRHPQPRCPVAGRPAGVMEQQTGSLKGCTGNAWPRDWEIELAAQRPVVYAPLPDWGPLPVPQNSEQ